MIEIKYIGGLPTRKCLMEIIEAYDPRMAYCEPDKKYGKGFNRLVWTSHYVHDKIDMLIQHFADIGIKTGKLEMFEYGKYVSGSLEIK